MLDVKLFNAPACSSTQTTPGSVVNSVLYCYPRQIIYVPTLFLQVAEQLNEFGAAKKQSKQQITTTTTTTKHLIAGYWLPCFISISWYESGGCESMQNIWISSFHSRFISCSSEFLGVRSVHLFRNKNVQTSLETAFQETFEL